MKEINAAGDDRSMIRNFGRTLADAIERYTRESVKGIGRTNAQVLRSILEYNIAAMDCSDIQSHHIVGFAKEIGANRTPEPPRFSRRLITPFNATLSNSLHCS